MVGAWGPRAPARREKGGREDGGDCQPVAMDAHPRPSSPPSVAAGGTIKVDVVADAITLDIG